MTKLLSLLGLTGIVVTGVSAPTVINNISDENNSASRLIENEVIDLQDFSLSSLEIKSRYNVISPNSLLKVQIPNSVVDFFEQQQVQIQHNYFEVTDLLLVNENRVPTFHDVNGARGAGQVRLKFNLSATKVGVENGIVGSTTMFYTINYEHGDLKQFDGTQIVPASGFFGAEEYKPTIAIMREAIGQKIQAEDDSNTALWFANSQVKISSIHLVETGEMLSQEVFDQMTAYEIKEIRILIEPTQNGKELGILNSAIIHSRFSKIEPR